MPIPRHPSLRRVRCIAAGLGFAAWQALAAAPADSGWGALLQLEGSASANTMALSHARPLVNPDACPLADAGYATGAGDPGANLMHTLLLSALLNRKEVNLRVSGCAFDKPRVISVTVRP